MFRFSAADAAAAADEHRPRLKHDIAWLKHLGGAAKRISPSSTSALPTRDDVDWPGRRGAAARFYAAQQRPTVLEFTSARRRSTSLSAPDSIFNGFAGRSGAGLFGDEMRIA
jgi:hypothetical protein